MGRQLLASAAAAAAGHRRFSHHRAPPPRDAGKAARQPVSTAIRRTTTRGTRRNARSEGGLPQVPSRVLLAQDWFPLALARRSGAPSFSNDTQRLRIRRPRRRPSRPVWCWPPRPTDRHPSALLRSSAQAAPCAGCPLLPPSVCSLLSCRKTCHARGNKSRQTGRRARRCLKKKQHSTQGKFLPSRGLFIALWCIPPAAFPGPATKGGCFVAAPRKQHTTRKFAALGVAFPPTKAG